MAQLSHIDEKASDSVEEHHRDTGNSLLLLLKKHNSLIAGGSILTLALVFCFHKLGVPSVWFDEAFSVELARQPLSAVWHLIIGPEPNMELYYLLLHFWLQLIAFFGLHQTEFIVRFPSALSASCASLVVYLLGRRSIGMIGACLAAILYILNDLQLTYAQQTRGYALQELLLCLSFFALLQAMLGQKHHMRWWIIYTLAAALSVYAHLFSFLVLFAQAVAIVGILIVPNVWQKQARQQIKSMLISAVALGVLSVPMLVLTRHGSKTGWLPIPHLHDVYGLFQTFSGNEKIYMYGLLGCISVGGSIALASRVLRSERELRERIIGKNASMEILFSQEDLLPWLWLLLCWLIIPIIASYIISHGSTRLFSSRYLVVVLPAFFLLVASGVVALRNRGVQALLIIELIFLAYTTVPQYYRSAQVEDWNSTSAWLTQHYHTGDGLVCYDNIQGCQISMEYYLHAYPANGVQFTADSPGVFLWQKYNWNDAGQALDTHKLAIYGTKHGHIFFIVARLSSNESVARVHTTEQWLDTHFHYSTQIVTPTVTVREYDTSSPSS